MNIVLATDDNFIEHCCVTLISIIKNNAEKINFFILTESLSGQNKRIILDLVHGNGSYVSIIEVNMNDVPSFPMPDSESTKHISIATYYRLFVSKLLPTDIDKILYLDCDIVVNQNLDKLWKTDLTDFSLGAVYQIADWNSSACKRLGYPSRYGYFNAGVLLINLTYWKEHDMYGQCLSFVRENSARIQYHDQDVLNFLNHETVKSLSCTYNMMTNMFSRSVLRLVEYDDDKNVLRLTDAYKRDLPKFVKDPAIIHFVSRPKPWEPECYHPYRYLYDKYRLYTVFHDKIDRKFRLLNYLKSKRYFSYLFYSHKL
jgi:lipopolysaccharide biosynthesis glycosyltransferase